LAAVCREAGLQAICQGLTKGLAPHQVFVFHQDLTRALTALKSKRLHREAISEDETKPRKDAIFSGRYSNVANSVISSGIVNLVTTTVDGLL
jgi:hypothetical protein